MRTLSSDVCLCSAVELAVLSDQPASPYGRNFALSNLYYFQVLAESPRRSVEEFMGANGLACNVDLQ